MNGILSKEFQLVLNAEQAHTNDIDFSCASRTFFQINEHQQGGADRDVIL